MLALRLTRQCQSARLRNLRGNRREAACISVPPDSQQVRALVEPRTGNSVESRISYAASSYSHSSLDHLLAIRVSPSVRPVQPHLELHIREPSLAAHRPVYTLFGKNPSKERPVAAAYVEGQRFRRWVVQQHRRGY